MWQKEKNRFYDKDLIFMAKGWDQGWVPIELTLISMGGRRGNHHPLLEHSSFSGTEQQIKLRPVF